VGPAAVEVCAFPRYFLTGDLLDLVEVQLSLEARDFAVERFEAVIVRLVFGPEPVLGSFPREVQVVELLDVSFVLALFGKNGLEQLLLFCYNTVDILRCSATVSVETKYFLSCSR
jgi:hypothetical protein